MNQRGEMLVWVALAVAAPAAARLLWPRLQPRLRPWEPYLLSFSPWLHGIGPAYLALIGGAVRARDFGIAGREPLAWAGQALLGALWLAILALLRRPAGEWPRPTRGVLDEPRWALYRAAGLWWLDGQPAGLSIGLLLAAAELGLPWVVERIRLPAAGPGSLRAAVLGPPPPRRPAGRSFEWETLARAATSTLFFALTGNFWLTLIVQGVALGLGSLRVQPPSG